MGVTLHVSGLNCSLPTSETSVWYVILSKQLLSEYYNYVHNPATAE